MDQHNFFSLEDRVAVVTGGGQGIGEGIATRLHAAGAKVAILDVNEEDAGRVAKAVDGVSVKCDVTSAASVEGALETVRIELGPVDIIVNNAGITGRPPVFGNWKQRTWTACMR